ncbi:hypothetical protein [Parerythrobacter jejuensis]|uniref:Lipoprotein n=1 Tax=Parerythrobacter jejuensis TaxID=795812 RepID=A0A845AW17_9SPHN|nr:hypothetical protein [Parerythrobacter jejuensis]MXP30998.1 hypothetical protein [Parerythrobacter jejuensis]MXP33758.1 hypothetical protein [Parerythrobacter jejuensis]
MLRKLPLILIPALAACAAPSTPVASTGTVSAPPPRTGSVRVPPTQPTAPPRSSSNGFLAPQVMSIRGLEGVIGQNAQQLQRQFGTARLDVFEGDARKLQFTGEACVLDIYLYPLRAGAEPTATYLDARRASDALDVDRVSCVRALRKR